MSSAFATRRSTSITPGKLPEQPMDVAARTLRSVALTLSLLGWITMAYTASGASLITAEMRANAKRNGERFEWAARYRDQLIAEVAPWMALSDDALWALLPSQDMPRDAAVNRGDGCPACGQDHYNAPYNPSRWRVDLLNRPWKVRCANCNEWFPKNDFAAYYRSALDESHRFRLGEGDPRHLRPEAEAPQAWTDDGSGAHIGDKQWFFAANYAFRLWEKLLDVTEKMALVYTLTEDARYAHKAAVLLDRMADLYPEMDYAPHFKLGMECSTGGSGRGRVQGKIWETWTAQKASLAYDHIRDALSQDEALVTFASRMAATHQTGDKSSPQAIASHIETHLLREFIAGVHDGRIHGNPGMHQYAMACAAVALDHPEDTAQALDWLFEPDGGAIPLVLRERLAREGLSDEAALGYSRIPALTFFRTAEVLRRYPRYSAHDLYRDYPKFRACFTLGADVRMLDTFSPNWGDGDKCMNLGRTGITIPVLMALQGYAVYGEPRIAREVWFANGKSLDGLFDIRPGRPTGAEDIYYPLYEADPEAVVGEIERDLGDTTRPFQSYNSGGHGMAVLQAPHREHPRGLALYYGRMKGHGHHDRLNILLLAENVVMTPDMGYPLYCNGTWRKRFGWVDHVISHNTCMVNDTNPDEASWSGKTQLFAENGPLRVVDVDGGQIYDGVSTFRRCVVMVDVDRRHSYVLDLFWMRGGSNHRLIQNGGGPLATCSGVALSAQPQGTYAGPDVAYGEEYDGRQTSQYDGTGFSYLENVSRGGPAEGFMVDWTMVEPRRTMPQDWEAHLRLHNLTAVDEVALCDGIPPRFKGNPERLRYLLRTRQGDDLTSQFISVLEPYADKPFIQSVRCLEDRADPEGFSAAVEVTLTDGRRDVLLVNDGRRKVTAGGVTLDGRVGLCRFDLDGPVTQVLVEGTSLRAEHTAVNLPTPSLNGRLAGHDSSDPDDIKLILQDALPDLPLAGNTIVVESKARSDTSYRILAVTDGRIVSLGARSLVERFVDPQDYAKGVVHAVSAGDSFRIPLSVRWMRER